MRLALGLLLLASAPLASAACYGTGANRTCSDNQGNTYQVQQYGASTHVQGNNARTGSRWSQDSQRIGNSTFTTGRASNGNQWNATTTTIGNATYTTGRDSQGRRFSSNTQKIGGSTYTTTTDSQGRTKTKVCNQYGCY